MKRLCWVSWFVVAGLGCAESVPVECPEGFVITMEGADCEPEGPPIDDPDAGMNMPDAGPDGGEMTDGGTVDPRTMCPESCDDGNECTVDSCVESKCENEPADDGTACAFGEGAGVCQDAVCIRDCEIEDCREVYPCTEQGLRDAIEDGGDIVIGCTGPQTIVLTEGELDMVKDVSIDGLGNLTVDAQGASRVFEAIDTAEVELVGMRITGGDTRAIENSGAGVYGGGDTKITIRDCQIIGNVSGLDGGGIRTTGKLTLENTTVSGNTAARHGGGIALWNEVLITDSTISDNESLGRGGGVWIKNSSTFGSQTVTIRNSVVARNQSAKQGGGIYANDTLVLEDTSIEDNVASWTGGGIHTLESALTMTGGALRGNQGDAGGAIATEHSLTTRLSGTVLAGNSTATGSGGAINNDETPLEVDDCWFDGNSATNAGGAVYSLQTEASFRRTTFSGNSANLGGAFRFYGKTGPTIDATFENCTVSDSQATDIGGAFYNRNATVTLLHTTVTGATATNGGDLFHLNDNSELRSAHSVIDGGCIVDPDSMLVSLGYNAVLTPEAEQCAFTPLEGLSTDLPMSSEEIGLEEMAANGGLAETHMPGPGSLLIDAIPADSCSGDVDVDQRGLPRDGSSACDIGAVELQPGE